MTRITRFSIMKMTRRTHFVLLYYIDFAHIHVRTNFYRCSRINYVSKFNCENSMLFVCVIFVSGISNFMVTGCTVFISSTYCHKLTAPDAIFGLRNDNKYFIKNFFFVLGLNFAFQTRINIYALILKKDFRICKSIT